MPGGARDGGTFHLLLISTLTGTRQTRLQASSLFLTGLPDPTPWRADPTASDRLANALAAHTQPSHSGRTEADELQHERPSATMNSHELSRAQNRGAVAAVGITEYSMPPPEESSGGSLPRSRGKSRAENPHLAPQHDATVVSIPRSHRCSAPAKSPDTRCLEAQLAQCEQTLWSVGSKGAPKRAQKKSHKSHHRSDLHHRNGALKTLPKRRRRKKLENRAGGEELFPTSAV